jgi:DNA-binding GntR family transcriptional regulator
VVREALRRMEDEDQRAIRLAKPTVEDVLTNLDEAQLAGIRKSVLSGLAAIERGDFEEYDGMAGLQDLAASVKANGRKALKRQ